MSACAQRQPRLSAEATTGTEGLPGACACTQLDMPALAHTNTHAHTQTHACTQMSACTPKHPPTCKPAFKYTRAHLCTGTHTCTYPYTEARPHTCECVCTWPRHVTQSPQGHRASRHRGLTSGCVTHASPRAQWKRPEDLAPLAPVASTPWGQRGSCVGACLFQAHMGHCQMLTRLQPPSGLVGNQHHLMSLGAPSSTPGRRDEGPCPARCMPSCTQASTLGGRPTAAFPLVAPACTQALCPQHRPPLPHGTASGDLTAWLCPGSLV